MKDPILLSYTAEELLYEYFNTQERLAAEKEKAEKESDKIEDDKRQKDEEWADKMEREELEAESKRAELLKQETKKQANPLEDPDNIKWMQEEIEKAKKEYGTTFGEDLSISFGDK